MSLAAGTNEHFDSSKSTDTSKHDYERNERWRPADDQKTNSNEATDEEEHEYLQRRYRSYL